MSFSYETVYGSPLLDEIHNHFPALLYAPDEFSNIRDVLHYIREQTRSRFDLFSFGQRRYRESLASRAPTAIPTSARTSYAPAPPVAAPARYPAPTTTLVSEEYEEDEEGNTVTATFHITEATPPPPAPSLLTSLLLPPTQEETRLAQALMTLLSYPTPTRTAAAENPFWNQFLQPVIVRPTAEQIRLHTTVGAVPPSVEVCTICQDTFETNHQGRKLNACGHWFHQTCIDTWFQRNVRCPICRHDIRTPASPPVSPRLTAATPSQSGATNP